MSTQMDEDLVLIEDLDFPILCETPKGCDNTAVWKCHTSCCGHIWLFCDKDKQRLDAIAETQLFFLCRVCDARSHDNILVGWQRL